MIRIIDGRPVEQITSGIFTGLLPADLEEAKPDLHFHGTPMPLVAWAQLISFFQWSYFRYQGESQARLYYRESDGDWKIVVLPQIRSVGLSTKEAEGHADREPILDAVLREGYLQIGTAHHHCSSGAFQSGTDHADEVGQQGLHITLGNLNRHDDLGFHSRVTYRKVHYPAVWAEWFGFPEALARMSWDTPFPEEWRARIIEPPPPPVHTPVTGYWSGQRYVIVSGGYAGRFDEDDEYRGYGTGYGREYTGGRTYTPVVVEGGKKGKKPKIRMQVRTGVTWAERILSLLGLRWSRHGVKTLMELLAETYEHGAKMDERLSAMQRDLELISDILTRGGWRSLDQLLIFMKDVKQHPESGINIEDHVRWATQVRASLQGQLPPYFRTTMLGDIIPGTSVVPCETGEANGPDKSDSVSAGSAGAGESGPAGEAVQPGGQPCAGSPGGPGDQRDQTNSSEPPVDRQDDHVAQQPAQWFGF